ncbi:MAG: hypothetical protein OEY64_03225 [Nitrospinota bacterium]|nr:hypothetical protein [Nitrospinota bacterium]
MDHYVGKKLGEEIRQIILAFFFVLAMMLGHCGSPAFAEGSAAPVQEYVEVEGVEGPELEKAWVVAPYLVVTSPKNYPDLNDHRTGKFRGKELFHLFTNPKKGLKAYLVIDEDVNMELSDGLPNEIKETVWHLVRLTNRLLNEVGSRTALRDEIQIERRQLVLDKHMEHNCPMQHAPSGDGSI